MESTSSEERTESKIQHLGRAYGHRVDEITWVDTAETTDLVSHVGHSVGAAISGEVMETFRRYILAEEACHWVRLLICSSTTSSSLSLLQICGWRCDLLASCQDHLLPRLPHYYKLSIWNHMQTKINSFFRKSLLLKGVISQQKRSWHPWINSFHPHSNHTE